MLQSEAALLAQAAPACDVLISHSRNHLETHQIPDQMPLSRAEQDRVAGFLRFAQGRTEPETFLQLRKLLSSCPSRSKLNMSPCERLMASSAVVVDSPQLYSKFQALLLQLAKLVVLGKPSISALGNGCLVVHEVKLAATLGFRPCSMASATWRCSSSLVLLAETVPDDATTDTAEQQSKVPEDGPNTPHVACANAVSTRTLERELLQKHSVSLKRAARPPGAEDLFDVFPQHIEDVISAAVAKHGLRCAVDYLSALPATKSCSSASGTALCAGCGATSYASSQRKRLASEHTPRAGQEVRQNELTYESRPKSHSHQPLCTHQGPYLQGQEEVDAHVAPSFIDTTQPFVDGVATFSELQLGNASPPFDLCFSLVDSEGREHDAVLVHVSGVGQNRQESSMSAELPDDAASVKSRTACTLRSDETPLCILEPGRHDEHPQVSSRATALEDPDLVFEILGKLTCTQTLHRSAATCKLWRFVLRRGDDQGAERVWADACLTVPTHGPSGEQLLTVGDALWRAPARQRVRIRGGTELKGMLVCQQPIHVHAEEGVVLCGKLCLQGGAAAGTGTVTGLHLNHFMEEAIAVREGQWLVKDCVVSSSRRARASTSITVRGGSSLHLLRCVVQDSAHAVALERGASTLRAELCSFRGNKEAILTHGGGLVEVEKNEFEGNAVALKLDTLVRGYARGNRVDGALLGRWMKPRQFRCEANECEASDTEQDG